MSKLNQKLFEISLFIAIFGSSIVGAKIANISLNKVCLIPLILFLWLLQLQKKKYNVLRIINKKIFAWYGVTIFSCIVGLLRFNIGNNYLGYNSNLIFYLLQIILVYIPIFLILPNVCDSNYAYNTFKKIIRITCRMHLVWGLTQFIAYNFFNLDINNLVLCQMLGGLGKNSWTMFIWDYGVPVMRITGINSDGAFFGAIMLLGIIFENKFMKLFYIALVIISLQRSALIGLAIIILYYSGYCLFKHKIKLKKIIRSIGYVLIAIIFFSFLYNNVEIVQNYVLKFINRFDFFSGNSNLSISSSRHLLYIPYSLKMIFANGINIFLTGIGPRSSGIIFSLNSEKVKKLMLDSYMFTTSWSIECDFADILLGTGIFGFLTYYSLLFDLYKTYNLEIKTFIVMLFFIGFMYGFSHLTLIQLTLIFVCYKRRGDARHENVNYNSCLQKS